MAIGMDVSVSPARIVLDVTSCASMASAATFYRKLAGHLPAEQISNLIQQWKEEQP
jgi:hypothetical protein